MNKTKKNLPKVLIEKVNKYIILLTTEPIIETKPEIIKSKIFSDMETYFKRFGYEATSNLIKDLMVKEKQRLSFKRLPIEFQRLKENLPNCTDSNFHALYNMLLKHAIVFDEDAAIKEIDLAIEAEKNRHKEGEGEKSFIEDAEIIEETKTN